MVKKDIHENRSSTISGKPRSTLIRVSLSLKPAGRLVSPSRHTTAGVKSMGDYG